MDALRPDGSLILPLVLAFSAAKPAAEQPRAVSANARRVYRTLRKVKT